MILLKVIVIVRRCLQERGVRLGNARIRAVIKERVLVGNAYAKKCSLALIAQKKNVQITAMIMEFAIRLL